MLKADRILVIRYRFIGDTILTVPFLRNLRAEYPAAKIDVLVGPQSGQVLRGCPYVNELIEFDTTRFHKYDSATSPKKHFLSYAWQLRKRGYDTAFVLKRSLSSALLSCLIGATNRIGYSMPGRDFLLTTTVPWNTKQHEVESTLDVLRSAGIPIIDNYLEAWVSPSELAEVDQIAPQLRDSSNHYLVHAPAAHPDKLYPLESWSEIIRCLFEQARLTPVFTGATADYQLYESLSRQSNVNALNLAGKLTLRQSMAVYKKMPFAICVDSGPAHMSAAVGTPTLAIFGPTDPERWRPFGAAHEAIYDNELTCRPCHYEKTCVDRPCLTQLSASRIVERALALYHRSLETVSC
jgi:heptosyltransferase II